MNVKAYIDNLLTQTLSQGISEAEVYLLEKNSFNAMCTKGEITHYASNETRGLGLRGLYNGKMGYASTEALDSASPAQLIKGVIESASLCEDEDSTFLYNNPDDLVYNTEDLPEETISTQSMLDGLLLLEKTAFAYDKRIVNTSYCMVQSGTYKVSIKNTHGLNKNYSERYYSYYIQPNASYEGALSSGGFGKISRDFSTLNPEEIANEAAKRAILGLFAKPVPSGKYKIIFNNECLCSLMSVFTSVFSGESEQKGLSLLSGKLNETIASPCVTLIDDPLLADGFGGRPFDSEGVSSKKHCIIKDGVFKTFLHNLKTAKKANIPTTANASKASYGSSIQISPSNFGFLPGKDNFETLCQNMENGLVITEVSGLHAGANPISGDFSLLSSGYTIKNGKIEQSVNQITIAGNFFSLLMQIETFANDVYYDDSGIFSPSCYVGELSVSGS